MRLAFVLLLAASGWILACPGEGDRKASSTATPTVGDPGRDVAVSAGPGRSYTCTDGTTFDVRIGEDDAVVTLQGNTLKLEHMEAEGAIYSGEGVTYSVQGEEATLTRAGAPAVRCTPQ
jgi:membrane-bound inhibitor of C-type lysozyme